MAAISSSRVLIAFACLATTVGVAACGSSDETTSSTTSVAAATSGSAATVDLGDSAGLGQILVDGGGRTLYMFEKDDEGDESYCSGDCAKDWPPFTTKGEPQAGDGVDAANLTTFKREDGATQIAYDDHPLYYFSGDTAAGEANGNGLDEFGAEWYALDASGQTVEGGEESEGSTDSTSTDSGYSY